MSSLTVRPSQTSHWPTDTMAVPIKNVVTTGISKVALTATECAEDGWEEWKVGERESGRGRMRSESLNLSGHGLIALRIAPHLTLAHPPTRASSSQQSNLSSLSSTRRDRNDTCSTEHAFHPLLRRSGLTRTKSSLR